MADAHEPLTLNQVVAWNIAFYRREAGLTQRELGERLGWSNVSVSEAERSRDGRQSRQFDAATLGDIALALKVPLIALFLPPPDDEGKARYAAGGRPLGAADLLGLLVMPDSDDDCGTMQAYRARLRAVVGRFLDPAWAAEVDRWLTLAGEAERRADRALRFRTRQAEALAAAQEWGDLAAAMEREAP